jgi:hypothetical protein
MRKKIAITIDENLLEQLNKEAVKKNLSLSRLIETDLKRLRGLVE